MKNILADYADIFADCAGNRDICVNISVNLRGLKDFLASSPGMHDE